MLEVVLDSTNIGVSLDIPGVTTVSANAIRGATTTALSPVLVSGSYVATLPYSITSEDGPATIEWTFTKDSAVYTRKEEIDVITPLFTQTELADSSTDFTGVTSTNYAKIESMVRDMIQRYTGQRFGYSTQMISVNAKGDDILSLPKRAINIVAVVEHGLDYTQDTNTYDIIVDGFQIKTTTLGDGYNIKIPAQAEAMLDRTNPIYYPFRNWNYFKKNVIYDVYGSFGWVSVPQNIKQAALSMAQIFNCPQNMWRDRYLASFAAADFRLQFVQEAYVGTGSVTVDQILDSYVVPTWVVI